MIFCFLRVDRVQRVLSVSDFANRGAHIAQKNNRCSAGISTWPTVKSAFAASTPRTLRESIAPFSPARENGVLNATASTCTFLRVIFQQRRTGSMSSVLPFESVPPVSADVASPSSIHYCNDPPRTAGHGESPNFF